MEPQLTPSFKEDILDRLRPTGSDKNNLTLKEDIDLEHPQVDELRINPFIDELIDLYEKIKKQLDPSNPSRKTITIDFNINDQLNVCRCYLAYLASRQKVFNLYIKQNKAFETIADQLNKEHKNDLFALAIVGKQVGDQKLSDSFHITNTYRQRSEEQLNIGVKELKDLLEKIGDPNLGFKLEKESIEKAINLLSGTLSFDEKARVYDIKNSLDQRIAHGVDLALSFAVSCKPDTISQLVDDYEFGYECYNTHVTLLEEDVNKKWTDANKKLAKHRRAIKNNTEDGRLSDEDLKIIETALGTTKKKDAIKKLLLSEITLFLNEEAKKIQEESECVAFRVMVKKDYYDPCTIEATKAMRKDVGEGKIAEVFDKISHLKQDDLFVSEENKKLVLDNIQKVSAYLHLKSVSSLRYHAIKHRKELPNPIKDISSNCVKKYLTSAIKVVTLTDANKIKISANQFENYVYSIVFCGEIDGIHLQTIVELNINEKSICIKTCFTDPEKRMTKN